MVKKMVKCRSETWICDVCGKESNSDDWTLIAYKPHPIVAKDIVVFKCPLCKKSNVYEFAYHSHIEVK